MNEKLSAPVTFTGALAVAVTMMIVTWSYNTIMTTFYETGATITVTPVAAAVAAPHTATE